MTHIVLKRSKCALILKLIINKNFHKCEQIKKRTKPTELFNQLYTTFYINSSFASGTFKSTSQLPNSKQQAKRCPLTKISYKVST